MKTFDDACSRIVELRESGKSYDEIAKTLMREKHITKTGRTVWGVGQVFNIYKALTGSKETIQS